MASLFKLFGDGTRVQILHALEQLSVSYTHLGINIWEYEGGYSYHGKSILIDDDLSVIGSFNMDMRSAYLDTELMLVIRSKDCLLYTSLQQLIKTILTVKKRLNRKLAIEGILLTMVDFRTNYARDIASRVHTTYGSQIEVFENVIPMSVKVAETSAEGKSIYMHCPKGKVAEAYKNLTQEVLKNEK